MTDTKALIAEIIDAQQQLQRSFAEDRTHPLFQSPLTMSQLRLLLILQRGGAVGGQELARAMGVSLATLTGIVDRMVAHGLVTRREDPNDRRVRRIELTDEGARLADSIITAGTQRLQQRLARIPPEDLELVLKALHLLCQAAPGEAGAQAPVPPGPARPAPDEGRTAVTPRARRPRAARAGRG
jgi:DNA-binding MarR family transcriptional regulator